MELPLQSGLNSKMRVCSTIQSTVVAAVVVVVESWVTATHAKSRNVGYDRAVVVVVVEDSICQQPAPSCCSSLLPSGGHYIPF